MPRTASARLSQTGSLLSSSDLLQFRVELCQRRFGVETLVLLVGGLDPFVDHRPADLLRLGLLGRACLHDVGAGRLEGVEADLVGAVPRLAVRAGCVLAGILLDDGLVLL